MSINRIRKTEDFKKVFRTGRKVQGQILSLYARQDGSPKSGATGIAVARKYAPRAVKRNYIRRVINASLRDYSGAFNPGLKVVVKLSQSVGKIRKKELSKILKKDLEGLFEKAGIIT